jgi:pimeloyl-ACP methyl ester carboxylesterase
MKPERPGRTTGRDAHALRASNLLRLDLSPGTVTYRLDGPAGSRFPPVVFVHGLLVDSRLWAPVASVLAGRGFRSYLPNWPTGSHPIPMRADADLSPRGIAKIVIEFLAALDLTDVTLVGSDTGGAICQYAIDTDHSRIARLVLTNCGAFDLFPPPAFAGLVRVGSHATLIKPLLMALKHTAIRHARNVYGGAFAGPPDPEITRSWIEPGLASKGVRQDIAKLIGSISPKDLLDVSARFGAFTKMVRVVWGDADPFFSLDFGRKLAAAFPNATFTAVPGGSTFIPMEFPSRVAHVISI